MSAKHPYLVSTAAAGRLLIMASTILGSQIILLGNILQGQVSIDSIDWDVLGAEAVQLRSSLECAISRSRRARESALKRRTTPAAEVPPAPWPPANPATYSSEG